MTKSRVFVISAVCFAAGILLQSQFEFPRTMIWWGVGIITAFLAVAYQSHRRKTVMMTAWWALAVIAGCARMSWAVEPNQYQNILNTKQQFDAIVVADVDTRVDKQLLTVRPKGFEQNILITTSKSQNYFYGDWLLINGKITEPKASEDFDYRAYLQRWHTYALMNRPKIIVLRQGYGQWWKRGLLKVKYAFIGQVNQALSEVESNLLLGILIGARKGLPEEVIDNFNKTGVSHVIAISGYNISILAASLGFLDHKIGRRNNFWLTLAIILAFVIMSGASASVVRAALMGGLVLISSRVGRLYNITPGLCAAATVMLLLNPRILYWDASFQLSFLATLGVVYLSPTVESLTERWWGLWGVKSIFLTTMSAIIATLPLILYQFGRLSIVAPVVNIIVLPVVPTTMLFGFLTGLPIIGSGFGLLAHWLLSYMLWITTRFAQWQYASTDFPISQAWFILGYSLLVIIYILLRLWLRRRGKQPWRELDSMIQ